MPTTDRTNEFRACVDSIRTRAARVDPLRRAPGARDAQLKQGLLANSHTANGHGPRKQQSKSEFARMAAAIGKDIASTTTKLDKLAQLAKRKTLFDDRPVEISELTYIIKQDIANLNKQIAGLQSYTKSKKSAGGSSNQVEEHNNNVVMLLQSKLANTSMSFKDVLEIRTQNMKESKDRTEQFMYSAAAAAQPQPSNIFNPNSRPDSRQDTKGKGRYVPGADDGEQLLAVDLQSAEAGLGNGGGNPFQQMQLVEQQDTYIQSRSTAIESIESTIGELGQIFTQLATMVAEQREQVQRIDADVIDISNNVQGAQRELLKYYASISSNRWLMMKVFGVIIVFFLVFILVS